MIIGYSKYGRGEGDRAVSYLTEGMASAVGYVTGRSRRGLKRDPAPVVLRGSPRLTTRLIRQVPFRRRYTSGVLSFSEKSISPAMEAEIMDRFEAVAFAGLPPSARCMLWVRHQDKGRHEMHFVSPAIHLATGKSLNINPPRKSTREMFDTFRRLINEEFRLSDPDDPARARLIRVPAYVLKGPATRDNVRAAIASYLEARANAGLIKSREDVLRSLRDAGHSIARVGENYVTVVAPIGTRCRLKGSLFEENFAPGSRTAARASLSPEERADLEAKLRRLVAARARFNQGRYGTRQVEPEPIQPLIIPPSNLNPESLHDRTGTYLTGRLGAMDTGVRRSQCGFAQAFEQSDGAARRWRNAAAELGRAVHHARRAGESLEHTARTFSGNVGETLSRLQKRSLTATIYRKYGIGRTAPDPERESSLELEKEPYVSPV